MFNVKRIGGVLVFFLTACIISAAFFSGVAAKEFTPEHIVLTWTGDPATTQTITWKTSVAEPAGELQYAVAATKEIFSENAAKIVAKSEIFPTNTGDLIIHTATLTGLEPGTKYIYRLGNGHEWSKISSFITSPPNISNFKFLVFGDSQSIRYDTIWRDSIRQAYQNNPDAAFLTVVGDLVDIGDDYKEWAAWFNAAAGVIDSIAVMPLTGNHENYTMAKPKRSMPEMFAAQFKLPATGPENFKGCAYSFDYGNTHFVILDSQEWEEAYFVPDMLEKQKTWLEEDLAATKKPWKIVFFHKPPYHSSGHGNDNIREAFVPIFDKYRVNMVVNGHDHVYARTYPLFGGKIAAPGYGTIYVTAGRSGTKTASPKARAHELHAFFHNPADEPNYLTVEVEKTRLTIKAFKQSGAMIDCLVIEKQSLGTEAA